MKIVMIHGQNHKGSTYNLARMFVGNFKDPEISEFFLPRDLGSFCSGCCSCIKDEALCPYYEAKQKIMHEVEAADLLVFSTPTYCLRASSPMKAFLELTFTYWMSHKPRAVMFSKKAVVISTAAGAGASSAVKDIKDALFYWGVPYIKTYGLAIRAASWDQVPEERRAKLSASLSKLAKQVGSARVRVGLKTRFYFFIMRMMQLKNMGAGEEERKYWESLGWLDKARPWKA